MSPIILALLGISVILMIEGLVVIWFLLTHRFPGTGGGGPDRALEVHLTSGILTVKVNNLETITPLPTETYTLKGDK